MKSRRIEDQGLRLSILPLRGQLRPIEFEINGANITRPHVNFLGCVYRSLRIRGQSAMRDLLPIGNDRYPGILPQPDLQMDGLRGGRIRPSIQRPVRRSRQNFGWFLPCRSGTRDLRRGTAGRNCGLYRRRATWTDWDRLLTLVRDSSAVESPDRKSDSPDYQNQGKCAPRQFGGASAGGLSTSLGQRCRRLRLVGTGARGFQITRYRFLFVEADTAGIRPNKTLVEDAPGELIETIFFERAQKAAADFRGLRDFLERDAALLALLL